MYSARQTRLAHTIISFIVAIAGVMGSVCLVSAEESTQLADGAAGSQGATVNTNTAPNPVVEEANETTNRSISSAPPPEEVIVPRLPPMRAVRQLSDSDDLKTMYKELITTKVPVLFQTMMMVENGAATGFIGSMNAVNGALNNTIESQDLYLKLLDSADSSGAQRYAYIKSTVESQQNKNKGVWPAALMYAAGDTFKKEDEPKLEQYQKNQNGGSSSSDLSSTGTGSGGGSGGGGSGGGGSGGQGFKLLDAIFTPQPGENASQIQRELNDQKEAWKKWIGDFQTEPKQSQGETIGVLEDKQEYKKATEFDQLSQADKDQCKNIYNYHLHTVRVKTWETLNEVMKQYCEFKKGKENYDKDIFEKVRPQDKIQKTGAWKKSQSPDVKVTINLIDQFFKLMLVRKPLDEVDCSDFKGDEQSMPVPNGKKCEDVSFNASNDDSNNSNQNQGFDNCTGDGAKTCLRNVLLYKITKFIAASKVNRYYADLWYAGMQRVTKPFHGYWLTRLACTQLGLAPTNVLGVCEAGEELERRADENFEDWIVFSNRLSKMAQGQGGSPVFRPAENNLSNFSAGAAGKGAP